MDIKNLKYFLAVADQGTMTHAANELHISQPALSHQIRLLEEELGCDLFVRHSHSMSLTKDGMRLRNRAIEIVGMSERIMQDFKSKPGSITGEIYLGAGESNCMRQIAHAYAQLIDKNPDVTLNLRTGYDHQIEEWLEEGSVELGILFEPSDYARYNHIRLKGSNRFGLVVRDDNPLAQKKRISSQDIRKEKLIVSRQTVRKNYTANLFLDWFGYPLEELDIIATIDLPTNATFMVQEGLGDLFTYEGQTNLAEESHLVFRPLSPELYAGSELCWKRNSVLSPASEELLRIIMAGTTE